MANASSARTLTNSVQAGEIVQTMLGQIPELTKLKQVKKRDGRIEDFSVDRVRASLARTLKDCGIDDGTLLQRMTEQVVGRQDGGDRGHR